MLGQRSSLGREYYFGGELATLLSIFNQSANRTSVYRNYCKMSTSTRTLSSPEWRPKIEFERISWSDIVEAEEQGDVETLNSLRYVCSFSQLFVTFLIVFAV